MKVTINRLKEKDAEDLFAFEKENRAYFEKVVPSRGSNYYNLEHFLKVHKNLLDEQFRGISYFYLIRNEADELLGRMNFIDIDRAKRTGQGIAHQALHNMLVDLKKEGFTRAMAKTTDHYIASRKVLERNGFQQLAGNYETSVMNGETLKFVHYMAILDTIQE